MAGRLVNEKNLELNITHEGMSIAGVGAFGFTQRQESRIGADVFFPFKVWIQRPRQDRDKWTSWLEVKGIECGNGEKTHTSTCPRYSLLISINAL